MQGDSSCGPEKGKIGAGDGDGRDAGIGSLGEDDRAYER